MLGETAAKYHKNGESCTACIFKACEEVYGVKFPDGVYDMNFALNNGLGINGMCSAVVTGVLFLGYYFKDDEAALGKARLYFLDNVHRRLGTSCCGKLKKCCKKAITVCGDTLEETIEKFG